jgi:hypothetical protein
MAGLVQLPDGQAARAEDVVAVKFEEFVPGVWYVYVELKNHPRVTIRASDKDNAQKIAADIVTSVNSAA